MKFYKTFTTKDTIVSINDSIRLVSKPIYIFNIYIHIIFIFCAIHPTPKGVGFSHLYCKKSCICAAALVFKYSSFAASAMASSATSCARSAARTSAIKPSLSTDTPTAKARWVLNYVDFQIYSKAYKTNLFH